MRKIKQTNAIRDTALRLYFTQGSETFGNIRRTAGKVGCNENTLSRWIRGLQGQRIKNEIAAENRIGSIVSLRMLQEKLLTVADKAYKNNQYHACISAINSLLKTIGGFQSDRLPDENLAGKMLDAKRSEDMRKIADLYYARKYLADGAIREAEKAIEDEISQSDTHDPPGAGA